VHNLKVKTMKTLKQNYRGFLAVTAVSITLLLAGASQSYADPVHNFYGHDANGYYDEHHGYHHWNYYHNQRGYWGDRNGVRVFINL
jgi:opacity protein-like surface antigen